MACEVVRGWAAAGVTEVHLWVRAVAEQQAVARRWYWRQGFVEGCAEPVYAPLDEWVGEALRTYLWASMGELLAATGVWGLAVYVARVEVAMLSSFRRLRRRRPEDVEGEGLFREVHDASDGDGADVGSCVPRGPGAGLAYGWVTLRSAGGEVEGSGHGDGGSSADVDEAASGGPSSPPPRSGAELVRLARAARRDRAAATPPAGGSGARGTPRTGSSCSF